MQLKKSFFSNNNASLSKPWGFTLIELMIVISILAIVAGIGGPAIKGYLEVRGLSSAVNRIQGDLQLAKLEAIKRNANQSLTFAADRYTYSWNLQSLLFNSYRGGVTAAVDPLGGPSAGIITFNSGGVCTASGSIYITSAANPKIFRIRVSAAGGISTHIWDPTPGVWRTA